MTAQAVLRRSRDLGLDPIEELHRKGLILSPAVKQHIRVDALRFILTELQTWRPAEMLRVKFDAHHTASPADMQACVCEWLTKHITHAEDRTS
jgi:hypothetical protein